MPSGLYRTVAARARHRCEYCLAPEAVFNLAFELDHIVPQILGGVTVHTNLALACRSCNSHKGTAVQARDPHTKVPTPLFHPRTDDWDEHFRLDLRSGRIEGLTACGRATARRLAMNSRPAVRARRLWQSVRLP
jgi:hypothetical protein